MVVSLVISAPRQIQSNIQASQKKSDDCLSLLYPASFGPYKNNATLLEALQSLHLGGYQFKSILCGHGTASLVNNSIYEDA